MAEQNVHNTQGLPMLHNKRRRRTPLRGGFSMSGLSFDTKTLINENGIKSNIEERARKTQTGLDSLILSDSNYFCPIKTGKLQQSAIVNSRLGSGELVWKTPYARRQYYDYHKPPYQPNPNACGKWFEAAKARWLEKWVRFVNERIKR